MNITVRPARNDDIPRLEELYRSMEPEQTARKPIWALTDGLDEQFDIAFFHALTLDDSWIWIGEIDNVPVGFVWFTIEPMLERAHGSRIGRIRLIYTEPPARGVGVGHAMLEAALDELREHDIRHFDAPVGPGQRASKNFFEAHGFAARSIIMHHQDTERSTDA
jgi:GNAT superfamily N-acetyltransferase